MRLRNSLLNALLASTNYFNNALFSNITFWLTTLKRQWMLWLKIIRFVYIWKNFFKIRPKMYVNITNLGWKSRFLIFVHVDDLLPVSSNFWQIEALTDINQIENVLLKAGTTKTNWSLKILWSDTRICTNSSSDLWNICPGSFADGRQRVNAGYPLSEKCIGCLKNCTL